MKKRIVIKLSGSAFGEEPAVLEKFASTISRIARSYQPIIVAGGGAPARRYIRLARSYGADETALDEMGIEISRLNARLLVYALGPKTYPHIPETLSEVQHGVSSGLIVVAGGLHPGHSTNGTAALIAEKIKASIFLNATDVDGVYDMDPKEHKNAKKFKKISVTHLKNMLVHEEAAAGEYDLMDIVALNIIERSRIKTRIILAKPAIMEKAVAGSSVGTEITFAKS